jgi:predicted Zn-dependent protease
MRRADALLGVIVGAFALFVGSRVAERRSAPRPHTNAPKESPDDSATDDAQPNVRMGDAMPRVRDAHAGSNYRDVRIIQRGQIARVANPEEIRAQIASSREGYLADMLVADSGLLVRWPDRREKGLRIWVQSNTSVRDWDLRYAQMARDAFADWTGNGLPARLDFVLDSASSDIQIVWVDRFPPEAGQRVGNTTRANDQNGWLVAAEVTVAVHDSVGRTIDPSDLAGIVRHEAGHALGLGHSNDSTTKMFPFEMTNNITPADRATLRLLYQLSPGSVR